MSRNIGNEQFPLYIRDAFIKRVKADFPNSIANYYPYIGLTAYVTPMATNIIPPGIFITKITGVIFVNAQLAGFEVVDPKTNIVYQAPKAAFHVTEQLSEDIHVYSSKGMKVKTALSYWLERQHDFYAPDWSGIEKLCFDVSKVAESILIESAGWYQYKMSKTRYDNWRARANRGEYEFSNLLTNQHNDGKIWRFILPAEPFSEVDATPVSTIINCHSMCHNHIWTLTLTITEERGLATTVFTNAFARGKSIGHQDEWVRSMKWAIAVAKAFESTAAFGSGDIPIDYSKAIDYMRNKLTLVNDLHKIKEYWQPKVIAAYKKHIAKRLYCYKKNPQYPYVTIAVNSWSLPAGKIGMYEHPLSAYDDSIPPEGWNQANGDVASFYKITDHKVGVLTINSLVFTPQHSTGDAGDRPTREYVEDIIKHELIHALLDERCSKKLHGVDFQLIANEIGLPEKYWN